MSHFTISIPSDSIGDSIGSSASLVILSDTETQLAVVPAVLPEIALEAIAAVVDLPIGILELVLHSDSETKPIEAPPSHDYHPGADIEFKPFEAESEEDPSRDDSSESDPYKAAEPIPAQVVPTPPVQISPTLPTGHAHVPHVIPRGAFAVAPLCRLIDNITLPSLDFPTSWDNAIPRRLNIFLWRLKIDKLPHRLNLSRRVVTSPKTFGGSFVGGVKTPSLSSTPSAIASIGGTRGLFPVIRNTVYIHYRDHFMVHLAVP
nr:RNA-directed DNA polymerase, eukaryota [Tanacetum cinerariifolium]